MYVFRKFELPIAALILASALSFPSCSVSGGGGSSGEKFTAQSFSTSYAATGSAAWTSVGPASCKVYEPSGNIDLSYSLTDLPSTGKTYLVLTNESQSSSYALYSSSVSGVKSVSSGAVRSTSFAGDSSKLLIRANPTATDFNRDPWSKVSKASARPSLLGASSATLRADVAGTTANSFYTIVTSSSGSETTPSVPATCRKVVRNTSTSFAHPVTLNVYVANASWTGSGGPVTQAMVDAVSDSFIGKETVSGGGTTSSSSCILKWDEDLFGDYYPDGLSGNPNFINDDRNITIFLTNLNASYTASSFVLGYFYGNNDYNTSVGGVAAKSNQRLMFFIDAYLLGTTKYDDALYSTLAHELQHMIHFSSKVVSQGGSGEETWLDEACSLVAEDYVSTLQQVNGPRGVLWSDATAGSGPITGYDRLNFFAYWPEYSLTSWASNTQTGLLNCYGSAYAFSAWLGRNTDPAFFKTLVQGSSTGFAAVEAALSGYSGFSSISSPGDILRAWALACLSSSSSSALAPYIYNRGAWYAPGSPPTSYKLGSIGMANYERVDLSGTGLWTWAPSQLASNRISADPDSNTYVLLQSNSASAPSCSGTVRLHSGVSAMFVVVP